MIIGFVSPKQYGKTTACNILKKYWGDDVTQINFKDGLVNELKQNFPDLLSEIGKVHDPATLFTEKPPLIRALMQNYGTEVRRNDNENYWVDKWKNTKVDTPHIIVDDVRFLNEAQAIKDSGGILIRLNRHDMTSADTHLSETEQRFISCDYIITVGEGEFEELEKQLTSIII